MKRNIIFITLTVLCLNVFAWNSPITIPDVGNARLRIVGQNMENYLTNFDASNSSCATQSAFDAKTNKMANVFLALQADIVAVCEAERNDEILGYLCDAMNTISGTTVWTYIQDGNYSHADYGEYQSIKSGYIYRSDKVTPVGNSYSPYTSAEYKARMRIQLFKENATDELFTLSVNHFKAKSGGGDQGESTRLQNASYLINKLSYITDDPDILIMGDLNAYMDEQPIIDLENAGYAEQLTRFDANAYTYVYHGEYGILDHAMANSAMASQVTGAYAYNINHEAGSSYKYSDHDPVLVGLNLGNIVIEDTIPETDCPSFEYDFRNGFNDWTVYDVSGEDLTWSTHETYGAQISAYNKNDNQEHWLISPALDMTTVTSAVLTLNHQIYYDNGETEDYWNDQTVWVSTDYTGGAPSTANWTQMPLSQYGYKSYVDATATIPEDALMNSNTRIAFKYTSPLAANANYWEIRTATITTECDSTIIEAIDHTSVQIPLARKILINGALYIDVNGTLYNITGIKVE